MDIEVGQKYRMKAKKKFHVTVESVDYTARKVNYVTYRLPSRKESTSIINFIMKFEKCPEGPLAGCSSSVAEQPHKLKDGGSNPSPATW